MGFLYELVNHLRLTWRLFWDDDVRWWHRVVFVVPIVYLLIPFRYDLLADLAPVVGLLDDWLLMVLCSYVFTLVCPRRVVRRHRGAIALSDPDPSVRDRARSDDATFKTLSATERLERYRHPRESLALALSVAVLIGLSALGGIVVGALLVALLGFSYVVAYLTQKTVLRGAVPVSHKSYPTVQSCLDRCYGHLPYVPVNLLVVDSPRRNAFTWGIDRPYTLVLHSGLVEALEEDELVAVLGHELGHTVFEHTFLSSLMGGMLYRRGLGGVLWSLVFLRWRRLAENTADRVALLACGQLEVVIRALIKLTVDTDAKTIDVDTILDQVYAQERVDLIERLGGLLGTHPQLAGRIRSLVDFDAELFALDVEAWLTADGPRS
jgi:Zn-dependent protease with chaperone function